ncbi:MAG: hypothetical protein GTN89_13695 [Acidobacteria bacterium]|nr:hypothetical protein [Acidobacteriota bacterium]NIM60338.1 hypothetical protein [Acidobacteriota bacterium]NIO60339.1 hypothetical protein [Acidobacteriota bacterium]NIQ31394.1 hypothetical protein [Acidobacteriota bacterium]NIQ86620.1 hypothetical protein [Acidobacteriota bacterium]
MRWRWLAAAGSSAGRRIHDEATTTSSTKQRSSGTDRRRSRGRIPSSAAATTARGRSSSIATRGLRDATDPLPASRAIVRHIDGFRRGCDDPIGIRRLEARPGSLYCLDCQDEIVRKHGSISLRKSAAGATR